MLASTKPGSSILSYGPGLHQPWICLVSLYAADVPGDSVAMYTQFMLKALERREVLLLKAALQQQKRNLQFLLLVRSLQALDTLRLLIGTSEFHKDVLSLALASQAGRLLQVGPLELHGTGVYGQTHFSPESTPPVFPISAITKHFH